MYPDAKHMHQLVFFYIKKKYDLDILLANILTGQIINIYNLIVFLVSLNFINNSKVQILLILFSIMVYTATYYKFFKYKYEKNV